MGFPDPSLYNSAAQLPYRDSHGYCSFSHIFSHLGIVLGTGSLKITLNMSKGGDPRIVSVNLSLRQAAFGECGTLVILRIFLTMVSLWENDLCQILTVVELKTTP